MNNFNKVAIFGESGSYITSKLIQYIFCKLKTNNSYDFCIKNFNKENINIENFNNKNIESLELLDYNNIIIFDLDYSKKELEKILKIISLQNDSDCLILDVDNKNVKEFYKENIDNLSSYKTKIIPISIKKLQNEGASFIGNEIFFNEKEYLTNEFKSLIGEQNKINILATFVFFSLYDLNPNEIIENLYNVNDINDIFEIVYHNNNVSFINDIKNENKLQPLETFENIYWILCINDIENKTIDFNKIKDYTKNIKYVFILGEYNDELLKDLKENNITYFIMYDMDNVFDKINDLLKIEKDEERDEEKSNIILSSFNNLKDNDFYKQCSIDFEKIAGNKDE